jgi:hypothetical protein
MKPHLKVEVAFNATPAMNPITGVGWFQLDSSQLDVDDLSETAWTDVTGHVRSGVSWSRGRSSELDRFEAGRATFVLDNRSGLFDRLSSTSPYSPEPLRPVRLTAELDGWSETQYVGYAENWEHGYDGTDATVTVSCVDGFGLLAAARLDLLETPQFGGELTSDRVFRVLERPEVLYPAGRRLSAGSSTVGDTTFGVSALDHLQQVATSEQGFLFVDRLGQLTFIGRDLLVNRPSVLTFASGGPDGIPVADATRDDDVTFLFNRVTVTGEGAESTADDPVSMFRFLPRTLQVDTLLDDPNDVEALAGLLVQRLAVPEARIRQVTVNLHDRRVDASAVIGLDVADPVDVALLLPGVDTELAGQMLVERVSHQVMSDRWVCQVTLSSSNQAGYLMLNDPEFGRLDFNRVAF